jgi:hypothetical protein
VSFIDVADLILDPDIAGQLVTIYRRQEVVNTMGESQITATAIPNIIVQVSPKGNNDLIREDGYQTQSQTIEVITSWRLRGATLDPTTKLIYQPDLVFWHGDYYVVRTVEDFTPYGAGLIVATCDSIDYQQIAAQIAPTNL